VCGTVTGAKLLSSKEMLSEPEYTDPKRVYTNFRFKEIPDFLKDALRKPAP